MLIEFSVENFRSIKEKATLSMLASAADKKHDDNLIRTKTIGKDRLLRSSVIYGGNASGKTNLMMAVDFLKFLVLASHSWQKGMRIPYFPFKLDKKSASAPSKFSVVFVKNGIKYSYGVSLTGERIVNEYLYSYPFGRKAVIFERKSTSNFKFTKEKERQEFFAENTTENVLYLSRATQLNCKLTLPAFEWFQKDVGVIGPQKISDLVHYTARQLTNDVAVKKNILNALNVADIDISDIEVSTKNITIDQIPFPKEMLQGIKALLPGEGNQPIEQIRITTKHGKTPFAFEEESMGTQKLFALLGPLVESLSRGQTLIIDELDTQLHYLIVVHLIKMFHDPVQNKKNAQLIFATHNLDLLDLDIFRRDQIWFTEKNLDTKGTDLYSLLEYKPRNDKDIKRGYLAGRYGALPYISSERMIP